MSLFVNIPFRASLLLAILCTGCVTTPHAPPSAIGRAGRLLQQAQRDRGPVPALGEYLDAAKAALAIVTDPKTSPADRGLAQQIYNAATARCAVILKEEKSLPSHSTSLRVAGETTIYRVQIAPPRAAGVIDPAVFDSFVESSKINWKHLKSDVIRDGLGGSLVGLISPQRAGPHCPPRGFVLPVTAVAKFAPAPVRGETQVDLSFFDPRSKDAVTIDRETYPLEGDFTAPFAYYPKRGYFHGIGAMLQSDRTANSEGVYFLEPFDPRKIPILFIQGFMSSPHAWLNFVNELDRNPEFRRRYQVWSVIYPSGAPIAVSALRLRTDLATIARDYPQKPKLVIIGNSMGGLLARMQVVDTGRKLWDSIFGAKADEIYAAESANSILKRSLIFRSNPRVSCVVFFATPHRGSTLADMRISSIAGSLIRMPSTLVHDFTPQMRSILTGVNPEMRTIPTSLLGMSPRSPLLKGLEKLPIQVPFYSIIGNRGKTGEPLAESTDGVVPYSSSHLDGARSETIVASGHDAYNSPEAVPAVLKILRLGNQGTR